MSGLARRAADRLVAAAAHLLPAQLSPWARAMACEVADISDDRSALIFALGCLRAAAALALADLLTALRPTFLRLFTPLSGSFQPMTYLLDRPRSLGLLSAAAAVGLGLAYMAMAGAPSRYLLMNLAALVLGATAWLAIGPKAGARLADGRVVLALSIPLLATALFGIGFDGVTRWVRVGPLPVQLSLVLLPAIIVLYARRPDAIGTAGIAIAALGLAAQPDRAMAGVLAAALAAILIAKPTRMSALALAAGIAGFGATLVRPDALPAVPFIDQILYTSFGVHPLAGLAVLTGSLALLVPTLGALRQGDSRPALLAFGACWLAIVAAAALGNYPTPLVGFGGSAVLGYLLSAALLPGGSRETAGTRPVQASTPLGDPSETTRLSCAS